MQDKNLKVGDECKYIKNGYLPNRIYDEDVKGTLNVYETKMPQSYFGKKCKIIAEMGKKIYDMTTKYKIKFEDGTIAVCESHQLSKLSFQPKTEGDILTQIYNDTLNDKLIWAKSYYNAKDYIYRANKKLDKINATLRFDAELVRGSWAITIYYQKLSNIRMAPVYVRVLHNCERVINLIKDKIESVKEKSLNDWLKDHPKSEDAIEIDCSNSKLTSLAGIEKFTKLKKLNCYNNRISSLKEVRNLVDITFLNLSSNRITSLEGTENLINLRKFYISNNDLKNLDGIERLINLEEFSCSSNNLSDFSRIKKLDKLKSIFFDIGNNITPHQRDDMENYFKEKDIKYY